MFYILTHPIQTHTYTHHPEVTANITKALKSSQEHIVRIYCEKLIII